MEAGLPSALYAVQGVLTYTAYQNLDPVTFNGLTQIKTLSAALCCFLIMGKAQSNIQIFALGLLSLSTLVFQGQLGKILSGGGIKKTTGDDESSKQKIKNRFAKGIVPCLAATFISGLAGAFSQKGLQKMGGNGKNAYLYTVEVSFFSGVCLLASILLKKVLRRQPEKVNGDATATNQKHGGYFDYWTWETFIPIVIKAAGGMLTALVHKYAGSVVKGFSLVLGLVFSGVFQSLIDNKDLSFHQVFGTLLVLTSSWLHFTNPAASLAVPKI